MPQAATPSLYTRFFHRDTPPLRAEPLLLTRRRVYILPSAYGMAFFSMLLVMLAGSMNYNNSMGFVLTFVLGSMALVSIFHTYRNLAGLRLEPDRVEEVFAGEPACFCFWFDNRQRYSRHALILLQNSRRGVATPQFKPVTFDLEAESRVRICLEVPTHRRGRLTLGRVILETRFPLGLFRAWTYLDFAMNVLVYPHPLGDDPMPAGLPKAGGQGLRQNWRGDDFIGYRDYQLGDSPRHVDWKIVAREKGWLVKVFGGEGSASLWFTWEDVGHYRDTEAALSQLCRWILQAENEDLDYGLKLAGTELPPASGPRHRRECLQALALFGTP